MSFFSPRYKLSVHIIQIMLALAAIGVSVIKLFFFKVPGAPRSRANTMALGIGAKSLIIIDYQLLIEHTQKCKKWASLKANMILNSLEVLFWAAVVFMMIQAVVKFCVGTSCILSWVVCVLGGILSAVAAWTAVVSIMDWRYHKANGMHRGAVAEAKNEFDHVELGEAAPYQK
ncbi:hypothetical protein V8E51_013982 [Hyaloscypha variabilis]